MRCELADHEWTAIKPMLPNKPCGVPRVSDRRVLNGIFWVLRSGAPGARSALANFAVSPFERRGLMAQTGLLKERTARCARLCAPLLTLRVHLFRTPDRNETRNNCVDILRIDRRETIVVGDVRARPFEHAVTKGKIDIHGLQQQPVLGMCGERP